MSVRGVEFVVPQKQGDVNYALYFVGIMKKW